MKRWGLAFLAAVAALTLNACATDAPAVSAGSAIEITRTGGDMGIDDSLVIQADGSWAYSARASQSGRAAVERSGKLSADKLAAAQAIVQRPGFAEELAVGRWEAHCIDPPDIVIKIDGKQSAFVSCDDPDQKNLNDLLQLFLEEVYNKAG